MISQSRLVEVVVQLQLETFFRLRVFFDADADDDAGVDAGEVNVVASNYEKSVIFSSQNCAQSSHFRHQSFIFMSLF